jgi:hypothetical protein
MAIPFVYLTDSSSQVWELGVTDSGAYTTTPVSGTGLNYILLQDTGQSVVWKMTVLTSGALHIIPYFGTGTAGILVESPSNYLYNIVVSNGAISTVYTTLISVSGGPFQDPLGNPYSYGTIVLLISTPATTGSGMVLSSYTGSLDSNGNALPFSIWPNSLLTPSTTFYYARVYKSNGQLVWYTPLVIPDTNLNLGTLVPQQ